MSQVNSNIPEKLKLALNELVDKDDYLLEKDLNERTICHKLANYLEDYYCDLDVDVEYNRDLEKVKDFDKKNFIYELKDIYIKSHSDNKKDIDELVNTEIQEGSTKRVLPDIIIHKRGCSKKNKIVIEVKKSNYMKNIEIDKTKLKLYKEKLHYSEAYFIKINVK